MILSDDEKRILEVYFGDVHKEIREMYKEEGKHKQERINYSVRTNLNLLGLNIYKNVKNSDKLKQIINLIIKFANVYDIYYNDNEIDNYISKNNFFAVGKSYMDIQIEKHFVNFNKEEFDNSNDRNFYAMDQYKKFSEAKDEIFNDFNENEKSLLDRTFDKAIFYQIKNKIILDFYLDENNKIVVNKALYKTDAGKTINLKDNFDGMTLLQAVMLLDRYGLHQAKRIVNEKRNEIEYKTKIIDDIYKCIIFYMMFQKNNIKAAKRAMIFAQHYDIDLNIPARYAFSHNDENLKDTIEYYSSFTDENLECFVDYFEDNKKVHIRKIKALLSDFTIEKPKTRKKK